MSTLRSHRLAPPLWLGALGALAVLLLMAAAPPWLSADGQRLMRAAFAWVCHQLPDRSPAIDGVTLAVCHRCWGIYLGLLAGLLAGGFYRLRTPDPKTGPDTRLLLVASLAPAGVDWGLGLLGVWVNTPTSRLVTGALFGVAAGYILARELITARPTEAEAPAS
ncbi:MAG: DUF2085 domain-containing protein [Bacteroidota bacterium]